MVEVQVLAGSAVAACTAVSLPDEEAGVDADRGRALIRDRLGLRSFGPAGPQADGTTDVRKRRAHSVTSACVARSSTALLSPAASAASACCLRGRGSRRAEPPLASPSRDGSQPSDSEAPTQEEAIHAPDASGSRLDDGAELLPQAKISEQAAITAAQTAASGPLSEVDLEDYEGQLVFNVDVGSHDVKVDAATGEVLAAPEDD